MKFSKNIAAVIMAAAIIFIFTACNTKIKNDEIYYSFTDSLENTVVLEKKPIKVAVLFSSFAEIWSLSGGQVDITVGESVIRGFADENAVLVDSGAGKSINSEILVSKDPDFVICSADIKAQVDLNGLLKDANIPTAYFRVDNFEDYLNMLKICTDITNHKDSYEEFGVKVKSEIEALLKEANKYEKKDILFIRAGSGMSSTKAKTADMHFVAYMLREIGTNNIAEKARILLDGLSIEEILIADPDFIFISTMGDEDAAKRHMDELFSGEVWQSVSAIKNNKYAYLPKELFQFKPNAKWAEAYRYLMELIYE